MPSDMMNLDAQGLLEGTRFVLPQQDNLVLSRLNAANFEDLLLFRANVVRRVGDPDILRLMPDEETYVRDSLDQRNFAIGVFSDRQLIAYNSQFWPQNDQELRELYIYDQTQGRAKPGEITYAGGVMVDPDLRGTGLQKLLIEARRIAAYSVGRRHHFSTVSFANHYSWRNVMETGGRVISIYEFEDPRYGYTRRMFLHQSPFPRPLAEETTWVDPLDIAAQYDLLACGHVGARFRSEGKRLQIAYQKEVV